MTVPEAKARLRREMRERLKYLTAAERAAASARICQQVRVQDFWIASKVVLLFAPLPDEVDVWPLAITALAEGKILALPRFKASENRYAATQVVDMERDLVPGTFGICEPVPHCLEIELARIDVALVPGLAFDASGRRLGRGKGFYDRLLADFIGVKCGVGLDEQIVAEIPSENHDTRMSMVVTGTRVLRERDAV
jgi:5-formyltetrahydrofolate cyclo-ligase